jgi:hypothetical protein
MNVSDSPTLFDEQLESALPPIPGVLRVTFDGSTYEPAHDKRRLARQQLRVFGALKDGGWWTLAEIHAITGDPEASISARLRDLRKTRFGHHVVDRRRRGEAARGIWEYRLMVTRESA